MSYLKRIIPPPGSVPAVPPPHQPAHYQVAAPARAVMIRGFYGGDGVPAWVATAEEVLRRHLAGAGHDARDLPPPRRLARGEREVASFLEDLLAWREAAPGRRAAHRLLYEAVRRLPGQAWFAESEGDALYLDRWTFDAGHVTVNGR